MRRLISAGLAVLLLCGGCGDTAAAAANAEIALLRQQNEELLARCDAAEAALAALNAEYAELTLLLLSVSAETAAQYAAMPDYDLLLEYPEAYRDQNTAFTGTVLQCVENGDTVFVLFAVDGNENTLLFCEYDPREMLILPQEGDEGVIYGLCKGLVTYDAVGGTAVTVPGFWIKYIETTRT